MREFYTVPLALLVDSIIKIVVIYILLYSGVTLHVLFAVRR
jgi:hypothetical protein